MNGHSCKQHSGKAQEKPYHKIKLRGDLGVTRQFLVISETTSMMNKHSCFLLTLAFIVTLTVLMNSCDEDGLTPIGNAIEMHSNLSAYEIYEGDVAALVPAAGYHIYELNTELFTDYAEKQRLIKIPPGSKIELTTDRLPDFPDGTILVKTFFYNHDNRDPSKGKRIIETRLLIKSGEQWNAGTYYWNDAQTDAWLMTTGLNKTVNWIDAKGTPRVISYHVPSTRECSTCHHSTGKIIPIGPKLRNLNAMVMRNSETINQLRYFSTIGLIHSNTDPASFASLPDWNDRSYTIEQRARAYLDVNCAHCHTSGGIASETNLTFDFESSLHNTRIERHKQAIKSRMENGTMPRLGTTVIHEEGLDLIREYINGL